MKASAPGKLVLSGAYSVLRGAPALVTAVDRRIHADSTRAATFEAPEVSEAISLLEKMGPVGPRPWYNAEELRGGEMKLGLGSSAAICVASLALLLAKNESSYGTSNALSALRDQVYPLALLAHRRAQGGGSGIDIAAACFGGTLSARVVSATKGSEQLTVEKASLPPELSIEVWASPNQASTSKLVGKVLAAEEHSPSAFASAMAGQVAASESALTSVQANDPLSFITALRQQHEALTLLGEVAACPIVLPAISELHKLLPFDACFIPSGAGGGDISLYVGMTPSPPRFQMRASELSMTAIHLSLGAPGLTIETSA